MRLTLRKIFTLLLVSIVAWTGIARSEPKLAVLELASRSDADWHEQDLDVIEQIRKELASRPGLEVMSAEDQRVPFAEPAEEAWIPLAKRAREKLARGQKFMASLKPGKAIKQLSGALRILRAIFPGLKNLSSLERAHLMLGMTYQALGKGRQAEHEYRMVLLLNPSRKLDETTVNPVVVEKFEKVRQRLVTSMKGSISLISKPQGARVYMDGRAVGFTPVTIPGVYPGEHYFSIVAGGYKTWFGVLRLKPGGLEKREVFLQEGQRIGWVHLLNRMARAGIGKMRVKDAQELASALGTDWLLLVSITHMGGAATLDLGIFESGGKEIGPLGIFAAEGDGITATAARVRRWIEGDHSLPQPKTFIRHRKDVIIGGTHNPPPPPPPPPVEHGSWYTSWWFWTAVGAVVAGAATTTTLLLMRGQSGIDVQVYR